jgi:hypothetical protein
MTPTTESDRAGALPTKHGKLEDASATQDENGNQAFVRDASVVLEMGVNLLRLGGLARMTMGSASMVAERTA